jgi:hypothetical protein
MAGVVLVIGGITGVENNAVIGLGLAHELLPAHQAEHASVIAKYHRRSAIPIHRPDRPLPRVAHPHARYGTAWSAQFTYYFRFLFPFSFFPFLFLFYFLFLFCFFFFFGLFLF